MIKLLKTNIQNNNKKGLLINKIKIKINYFSKLRTYLHKMNDFILFVKIKFIFILNLFIKKIKKDISNII